MPLVKTASYLSVSRLVIFLVAKEPKQEKKKKKNLNGNVSLFVLLLGGSKYSSVSLWFVM